MNKISRRTLASMLGSGAVGIGLAPLTAAVARKAKAHAGPDVGFGPLTPKLPANTAELPEQYRNIEFVALPEKFDYKVISTTGETMSDGNPVAGGHDGMAAYRGKRNNTLLVRNHELRFSDNPVIAPDYATYNPALAGGTSNIEIDGAGNVVKHYNSIGGTERNCAGGPTPWDSWLTCEETFADRDGVPHGYVFDVPADGFGDPMPLVRLGRFSHEAAAVDPYTGYVYLTEDRGNSCLYRFRPAAFGDLRSPGQLEALRLTDWPDGVDTSEGFLGYLGTPLAADWVPVDDYDPVEDTCREEGQSKGAAVVSRGEGCWYGNGLIYFCSTNGGDIGEGQVFAYNPQDDTVTLVVESTDPALLEAPDNIVIAPDGRLYMFEDGGGVNNVVGADYNGELFIAVSNVYNGSEFAGGCFAHHGRFMIVNIQSPGLTLVIKGPWDSRLRNSGHSKR